MKLLIFGATGVVGGWAARKAFEHGHQVTLYVRDKQRVPDDIKEQGVKIIEGGLDNELALSIAIQGQDAILSSIGTTYIFDHSLQIFQGYKLIMALMRQHNVRRILAMGTISTYDAQDGFSLHRSFMYYLVYLLARGPQKEVLAIEKLFREEGGDLDWTFYRVGGLLNSTEDHGPAEAGWVGDGKWRPSLQRRDWANWLVQEAERETPRWVREMPAIYTPKRKSE
ncbi:hypothetical protein FQN55_001848 [Onygenales sp. PD_40]|nr:hypothetical protein FQN55_001848 [Onygenales sp. PD_40]KAK2781333.1 hypothetical protein FQN53_000611 [Emmonsiellopsis sp. PD_33]